MKKIILIGILLIALSLLSFGAGSINLSKKINEISTEKKTSALVTEGQKTYGDYFQVDKVVVGNSYALFLTSENYVYGTGMNGEGQLGIGVTGNINTPKKLANANGFVNGTTKIVDISAGVKHATLLAEDGTVYAFGENIFRQLGNGTATNSSVPVKVADANGFINGTTKVIAISSGEHYNLMLTEDGTVYGFGFDGVNIELEDTKPHKIADASGFINGTTKITKIEVGRSHYFLLAEDGTVYAFGRNTYGELGNKTNVERKITDGPVKVADANGFINGTTKIIDISAGTYHTIMLTEGGTVYGFGNNDRGRLGIGTTEIKSSNVPVKVADANGFINGTTKAIGISAGHGSSYILTNDGILYSFGFNLQGQLGDGTTENKVSPVRVADNPESGFVNGNQEDEIVSISSDNHVTLATNSGTVYAFGYNFTGELGNGFNGFGEEKDKPIKTKTPGHRMVMGGTALDHSTLKYSSDVVIDNVINAKLEIKESGAAIYTDITSRFSNIFDTFTLGAETNFIVNDMEEKKFEIKLTSLTDASVTEKVIIVDKKPPMLAELIYEGTESNCNIVEFVYCNDNTRLNVEDFSGIYKIEKEINGVMVDITNEFFISNSVSEEFLNNESKNEEHEKIKYKITDWAGNQGTVYLILDNYHPRVNLK